MERRGSGGWESVRDTERAVAPGAEGDAELHRTAVSQFDCAADVLTMGPIVRRAAETARLRTVYP